MTHMMAYTFLTLQEKAEAVKTDGTQDDAPPSTPPSPPPVPTPKKKHRRAKQGCAALPLIADWMLWPGEQWVCFDGKSVVTEYLSVTPETLNARQNEAKTDIVKLQQRGAQKAKDICIRHPIIQCSAQAPLVFMFTALVGGSTSGPLLVSQ